MAAVRRITEYKTLFLLHPIIATDAEIERETGLNRAEIARISQELAKGGQLHQGRTINGNYYRLTYESQDKMKGFINAIKDHLDKVAQTDEAFARKYAEKCAAEANSVENCCKYIIGEVQKHHKHGSSAVLTDAEVFGMAMHYYDENLKAPEKSAGCTVVVSKTELTEEDKERLRNQARAEAEHAVIAEEHARIAKEKALKEAEQKKAEEKARKAEEAKAKRAAEAERKRQEELERKRKEYETADLLFSFDDEEE